MPDHTKAGGCPALLSRSRRSVSMASPIGPGRPLCCLLEASRMSATYMAGVKKAVIRGAVIGGSVVYRLVHPTSTLRRSTQTVATEGRRVAAG
ncbi:MAG: hypothetical protein JWP24_1616 [Marmoricola sp.]|nr:hypothetical protein [Marmoricola sp.]